MATASANVPNGAPRMLEGLRVLSLAEQFPGPYAGLILADLGADVTLVERPAGGDPTRALPGFFASLNRGKRSLALDLKTPEGRAVFLRLAERADVVMEGFRPGVVERLGVDYAAVSAVNPRIVYASISGYGQDGPYRERTGHDLSYQANAGVLHEQAESGVPGPPPDLAIADLSTGLFAAVGVLGALSYRTRSGRGLYIDVSMMDCLVSLMSTHVVPVANGDGEPGFPYGPGYGVFRTADDRLLTVSVAHEDHFWRDLCGLLGMDDVADLDWTARKARTGELRPRVTQAIAGRDLAEWEDLLGARNLPFGPVLGLDAVAEDAQVRARGLFASVTDDEGRARRYVRQPLKIPGQTLGPTRPAPAIGQHTRDILAEFGFADAEIRQLADADVVTPSI